MWAINFINRQELGFCTTQARKILVAKVFKHVLYIYEVSMLTQQTVRCDLRNYNKIDMKNLDILEHRRQNIRKKMFIEKAISVLTKSIKISIQFSF